MDKLILFTSLSGIICAVSICIGICGLILGFLDWITITFFIVALISCIIFLILSGIVEWTIDILKDIMKKLTSHFFGNNDDSKTI